MSRPRRLLCRVVAAILLTVPTQTATAGRDEDLFIRPEDQRTVLFGSLDGGRSGFASFGAKQTLVGPLDRTGFVLMEATGVGLTRERYRAEGVDRPALRFVHQVGLLAGHQWSREGLFVTALVGPEGHREQVTVDNRIYGLSQPRLGLRGQFEVWAHPSRDTLLTATAVLGTARTSAWARVSAGIAVAGRVFVGPEVTSYVTPTYTEVRWGGHVTGFTAGLLTFRLSAGWMTDDAHRRGTPYAGLTAWIRL